MKVETAKPNPDTTLIVNNADLRKLIDDVRHDVFKMTREKREEQGLGIYFRLSALTL